MELLKEHQEALNDLKEYLILSGNCYTSFQMNDIWSVFSLTFEKVGIDEANFWVCSEDDPDNMVIFDLHEVPEPYTREDKLNLLDRANRYLNFAIDWDDETADVDERVHIFSAEFRDSHGRHRTGANLYCFEPLIVDRKSYEQIFKDLGLLLEVFHSRIMIKDFKFASKLTLLTPREMTVMQQLVKGQSRDQTAFALEIAPDTYDKHIQSIKGKLGDDQNKRPLLESIRSQIATSGAPEIEFRSELKDELSKLTSDQLDRLDKEIMELREVMDGPDEELSWIALPAILNE